MRKNIEFEFESLKVWQRSVDFAVELISFVEEKFEGKRHFRLVEQLESAVSSVSQNIAEGKGRKTDKDYMKFLYYSRGSLYEVVTLLEVFYRKSWMLEREYLSFKRDSYEIALMLNALITAVGRRGGK